MNPLLSFRAIAAVARKEFLHVWRDRRVLVLILILPPFFESIPSLVRPTNQS